MDPGYPTPIEEDDDDQDAVLQAVRKTSTRGCRTRRTEASAVLGRLRVSQYLIEVDRKGAPGVGDSGIRIEGNNVTNDASWKTGARKG